MKSHFYKVHIEEDGNGNRQINFDFDNHDDLFAIINRLESHKNFSPEIAMQFGSGLKLFADAVRKNSDYEPFCDILPHLKEIMKIVKGKKDEK